MKLLIFYCALLGLYSSLADADSPLHFPLLEGENLEGKDIRLPEEFHGKPAWVILGFTKDSQKSTKACSASLETTFPKQGFSVAIIQGAPFFIKGMIKSSIRSEVPEDSRTRYFVLSEGRESLKTLSGFDEKSEDDAYIIGLIPVSPSNGKDYTLVFKSHGTCNETHLNSVKKLIKEVLERKLNYPVDLRTE